MVGSSCLAVNGLSYCSSPTNWGRLEYISRQAVLVVSVLSITMNGEWWVCLFLCDNHPHTHHTTGCPGTAPTTTCFLAYSAWRGSATFFSSHFLWIFWTTVPLLIWSSLPSFFKELHMILGLLKAPFLLSNTVMSFK